MFLHAAVLVIWFSCTSYTVHSLDITRFGTKNPYHAILVPPAILDEYSMVVTNSLQECPAIHTTGIYRHGARNPVEGIITGINSLYDDLANVLSTDMSNWQNNLTKTDALLLNRLGEEEMLGIASRLGKRLSTLLAESGLKTEYISSDTRRTKESARYFHNGLSKLQNVGTFDLKIDDSLIKHYDSCPKYISGISNNESALAEVNKFENGAFREQMVQRVRSKLTLSNPNVIDRAATTLIYQYCAYESGIYNQSVWCNLLEDIDVTLMEYLDDLKVYWMNAYGHPLNYQKACPLVSDIFKGMDFFVNDTHKEERKTARFMFGHTPTVMPLIAALGLYKDAEPLLASNMTEQANRVLKSSSVMPFSANLVFVLYRCNTTETTALFGKDYRDKYMVRLFDNEDEITFPGCREGYCPYSFLREKYYDLNYGCQFDELCTIVPNGSEDLSKLSVTLLLSIIMVLSLVNIVAE